MKTIALKTVKVEIGEKPVNISYKKQLIEIIRNPSKAADYEEVRHAVHILDLLDKADGTLTLEDADFEYLKERVTTARWPLIDKWIETFIEDVTNPK